MGLLNSIVKTAKEMYEAEKDDKLDEYVGGKISNFVKKLDGSEQEDKNRRKDELIKRLDRMLESDTYDNQNYQKLVDKFLSEYVETSSDVVEGFYYKSIGWYKVIGNVLDALEQNSSNRTQEETDEYSRIYTEAREQCLNNINEAIKYIADDVPESMLFVLFYRKALVLRLLNQPHEGVRWAIKALSFASDEEDRNLAKDLISAKDNSSGRFSFNKGYGITDEEEMVSYFEEGYVFPYDPDSSVEENVEMMEFYGEQLQNDLDDIRHGQRFFSNRPYHDRQFVFVVRDLDHIAGCYDDFDNIKYVFPLDEIPKDISFPLGHPQPNTLYYAHPLRPVYLPFENAQLQLFYEKIQEMCRLFQCLGATQITARCLKGVKITEDAVSTYNASGQTGVKSVNVSGEWNSRYAQSQNRENRDEMQLTQRFSPKKAPYCPDDLLWTLNDPELQSLIRQRLEGGLLNFTKKVSSYETSSLSQNQVNDVKAAFENMMANVSANYSSSTDRTFSSTSETEWEISVEFMPLEELPAQEDNKQTGQLKSVKGSRRIMIIENFVYYEAKGIMVKGELLRDVKCGDKLLISDGKNVVESEIAGVLFPQFGFKILDEGEKGDKVWLQIRDVNAGQLACGMEVCIVPENEVTESDEDINVLPEEKSEVSLTPEEERYKEEIFFCLEEGGTISEDDRKYLERKRKKLGLSEERAKELEEQFASSLSSDEQEYLETFKEMCASGIVTDRVRRLLEREREALNISKERADEIEKMASEN